MSACIFKCSYIVSKFKCNLLWETWITSWNITKNIEGRLMNLTPFFLGKISTASCFRQMLKKKPQKKAKRPSSSPNYCPTANGIQKQFLDRKVVQSFIDISCMNLPNPLSKPSKSLVVTTLSCGCRFHK